MFGRKKRDSVEDIEEFDDAEEGEDSAREGSGFEAGMAAEFGPNLVPVGARTEGPWDVSYVPDSEVPRVDLGGVIVPIMHDMDVRVDVGPEGDVVAATMVLGESSMQINAFAAPKTYGIWDEVLTEIEQSLTDSGGTSTRADGPFGAELHASVPTELPGGGTAPVPARFLGVDGPRWFLRALLTGPAAQQAPLAEPFVDALRNCVVVRGDEAMVVRDPLPMRVPREVQEQALAAQEAEAASLELPERGPEITEVR
ncbi:MAG TPA: DUF3710 domain-containing protein [Mycobacteriales bacterium]|nr:DUF3710 domain-containing protein [Mycobacteriales bacterium]